MVVRVASLSNIETLIITYTILGIPYYNYSIMGPQNHILIHKAHSISMSWPEDLNRRP